MFVSKFRVWHPESGTMDYLDLNQDPIIPATFFNTMLGLQCRDHQGNMMYENDLVAYWDGKFKVGEVVMRDGSYVKVGEAFMRDVNDGLPLDGLEIVIGNRYEGVTGGLTGLSLDSFK